MLPGVGLLPCAVRLINDALFIAECLMVLWPWQHERQCAVCEKRKAIFGIQLCHGIGGLGLQAAREGILSASRFEAGDGNGCCGPELAARAVREQQRCRIREVQ